MLKIAVFILALFSVVLTETTFKEIPKGARSFVTSNPAHHMSYPIGSAARDGGAFTIPADNGGNWGDNLWEKRAPDDVLISREIQVNPLSNSDLAFNWTANFPGDNITHIRFVNIGRQRAFVSNVMADKKGGPTASGLVELAPNQQFRLLIEVYVIKKSTIYP